ncbi:CmcJ/NvfI family oxidoreductase [Reyranella sp.]|uniref:CmcJ/NvfI family oxidoreductase n=1 Tax=Reyranella sp. TaxID=1929291 RepID=UPI003BAD1658
MAGAEIEATINYHDRREAEPDGTAVLDLSDYSKTNFVLDPRPVAVRDGRLADPPLSLDRNGVVLLRRPTAMTDFFDQTEVETVYVPEIQAMLREVIGADEVLVFGPVLRSDDPAVLARGRGPGAARDYGRGGPAISAGAHVDFDEAGIRAHIGELAPDRAEELLRRRFVSVNVWRPIAPIERMPLAVCDAASVDDGDFIPMETRYSVGATILSKGGYNLAYNPAHCWYRFPRMQPDEVLIFKICDSRRSGARFTPHAAFADPTSGPDAAPRQSFEIRTICFPA